MSKLKFSCLLIKLFIYSFIYLCLRVCAFLSSVCVCECVMFFVCSSSQYALSLQMSLHKGLCVWVWLIAHTCWDMAVEGLVSSIIYISSVDASPLESVVNLKHLFCLCDDAYKGNTDVYYSEILWYFFLFCFWQPTFLCQQQKNQKRGCVKAALRLIIPIST